MAIDLPLRCSCGSFRAVLHDVSPQTSNRVSCCCSGCQKYARHLGREAEILDEYGGTEVFQASPASLDITQGRELLKSLQQTPKGARRWYASCCSSPLANALPFEGVPFMGLIHTIVNREAYPSPLEEVLGEVRARVNGKFDKKLAKKLKATTWNLIKMIAHLLPLMVWWRLRGDQRRWAFGDARACSDRLK